MRRKVMDNGFRRIKAAPVAAEPQVDPRLALVEQFATAQAVADPVPVPVEFLNTEEPVDLASMDIPVLTNVFEEDSQEPAEQTQPDSDDNAPHEAQEAADEAPADAEQVEKDEAQEQKQDEQDYDPIAAVLG